MNEHGANSLFYWFPRIENLKIPVPKTLQMEYRGKIGELVDLVDGKTCENVETWIIEIKDAIEARFSYPVFIRGDESANKHEWKSSCFLKCANDLKGHVINLIEYAIMEGFGFSGIVAREFLELDWRFHAFHGMPIAKERRYFVKKGMVECWHPYWTETSIWSPDSETWLADLRSLNESDDEEIALLTRYAELAGKELGDKELGDKELGEYWSIDFCKVKDGTWYLTDVARGEMSYHWATCPNASPEFLKHYGDPLIHGDQPLEKKKAKEIRSILDLIQGK